MGKAVFGRNHICAGSGHRGVLIRGDPITTHPRSQVDDDICAAVSYAVDHLFKKLWIA